MCDMTHSYVWRDAFICVTWLICEIYVTWHDSAAGCTRAFGCVLQGIHLWLDSFIHNTHTNNHSFIHATHTNTQRELEIWGASCSTGFECMLWGTHVWYDSFMCDMTHSYAKHIPMLQDVPMDSDMWRDTYLYVTWLIHTRITYSLLHLKCHFANLNTQSII